MKSFNEILDVIARDHYDMTVLISKWKEMTAKDPAMVEFRFFDNSICEIPNFAKITQDGQSLFPLRVPIGQSIQFSNLASNTEISTALYSLFEFSGALTGKKPTYFDWPRGWTLDNTYIISTQRKQKDYSFWESITTESVQVYLSPLKLVVTSEIAAEVKILAMRINS